MSKRRSSTQLEQEKKSRLQLEECLSDFGWHLTSPSPDLGEDFIVEIYHNGQNTGVTFYVQEKSTTTIEKRKTKDNRLVYTLKVKDLKHWDKFSLPVVIIVWDVNLREGKWALVKDLISHLNQNNPKWRNNKKDVQVHIPWGNGTDNESLKRLRAEIGRHVYPLISLGKDLSLKVKLAFPNTPDGMKLQNAFDLHIKEGEPVTLKGDVIQELRFSDWWEAWFGGFDLMEAEIHIGASTLQQSIPISFKIIPHIGGIVSLSKLDFRLTRSGTELIKLNNEYTECPLLLNFSLRKEEKTLQGNLTFRFRHVGGDPHEIMSYLDFTKAIASGGKLRLEFHNTNQVYVTEFSPVPNAKPDPIFYDLVQKLCVVQNRMRRFFRIPKEGISYKDANAISELFDVVEIGVVKYSDTAMSLELKDKALQMLLEVHREGNPIRLKAVADDSYVELFGEEISTGPMVREITGVVETGIQEFEEAIRPLSSDEFLKVKLVKVNGTEVFSNWQTKDRSLG